MDLRLDDPDPAIRDLAYLLFLEELLGGQWVERWARERGTLDALREWREVARPTPCDAQAFTQGRGTRRAASGDGQLGLNVRLLAYPCKRSVEACSGTRQAC